MSFVNTQLAAVWIALGAVAVCPPAGATGFRLPDQDAFATGRGEAFAATADNPSAVYYNPAGLTQLKGHHVRGGVYGLYLETRYESPAGRSFRNEEDVHAIPQVFYAYGAQKLPLSFGLGIYAPYGLSSSWPEDTGFRTVAIEGRLRYQTINPAVAWQVLPTLSVGGGITFNLADIDLQRGLTPLPHNDLFRFKGDDLDVGFNLGLLWKPHEKVALGISYRSPTTMDFEGSMEVTVRQPVPPIFPAPFSQTQNASSRFPFPQNLVFGISYRPTPKWNFEFNADYTDWNRLNTVAVQPVSGPSANLVLDWESSWYFEFGGTRDLGKGWYASAGYIFNQNSVPDAHYTPMVYDLDRHFLSVGSGFQGRRLNLHLAYQFGYGPQREVRGSELSLAGESADGNYDFLSHAVTLTLAWRF